MPKVLLRVLLVLAGCALTLLLMAVVVQVWGSFPPADILQVQEAFWQRTPAAVGWQQQAINFANLGALLLGQVWPLAFVLLLGALATWMVVSCYGGGESAAYLERVHALEEMLDTAQNKGDKLGGYWDDLNDSFDRMFEGSGEMWLVVSGDGRIRRWNDASLGFARRLIPNVESLEASKLAELWPAYTGSSLEKAVAQAYADKNPWHGEMQVAGHALHLMVWVWPLGDDVAVLARDVSAKYQPDSVFKSSESLVRNLVEESHRPMAVMDASLRYLYVSQGWGPFFNLPAGARLMGRKHDEIIRGFPPNLPNLMQAMASGQRVGRDEDKLTINNREEVIRWAMRPWRDGDNRLGGYVFTITPNTELVRLRQQLKQGLERENALAYSDTLTGLPNRQLFNDRLGMAIATAYRQLSKVALIFIDLDGFKQVNDTLGHDYGDMLLKQVAERLKKVTRETDTVARLGGDEFTVILNVRDKMDAELVAKKILETLHEPFSLNGQPANIGGSLGVGMYPTDGTTAAEIIKKADAAMYEAKNAGKNTYRFATKELVING